MSAQAEPPAGSTWTEPTTGMEFVWVPSGCFDMGSNDGDASEQPVHRVCVEGFYLGKYEVTQAQYEKVIGNNPSYFKGPNRPVDQVSWNDAQHWLLEVSADVGVKLRLPSEAEWEYACRAGGQHDPFCGAGGMEGLGWYSNNSGGQTHDVGGKRANAWGLYDMSGNVSELTQDCTHVHYEGAHTGGSAWWTDCDYRIGRGGSWALDARDARAANQTWIGPGDRGSGLGFRLARTPQLRSRSSHHKALSDPSPPTDSAQETANSAATQDIIEKPAYGIGNPGLVYPIRAWASGQQGRVILRVHILPDGMPGKMWIKQSSGSGILDADAYEQVGHYHFKPAKKNGQPIPYWISVPVIYYLNAEKQN